MKSELELSVQPFPSPNTVLLIHPYQNLVIQVEGRWSGTVEWEKRYPERAITHIQVNVEMKGEELQPLYQSRLVPFSNHYFTTSVVLATTNMLIVKPLNVNIKVSTSMVDKKGRSWKGTELNFPAQFEISNR